MIHTADHVRVHLHGHAVEYADLAVIDLSKFATPEGRAELATLARDAIRNQGFFYAINHGLTPEQVSDGFLKCPPRFSRHWGMKKTRIFDIADVPFAQVSDEEKQKYAGKMLEVGSYQGYKLRQYWVRA